MSDLNTNGLKGHRPHAEEHGIVMIIDGQHSGRVGFYDDDDWSTPDGGKALVYIGPKVKDLLVPLEQRFLHAIPRTRLLVLDDPDARAVAEAVMRPAAVAHSALAAIQVADRFGEIMTKHGGGTDLDADLKLVEAALEAYRQE